MIEFRQQGQAQFLALFQFPLGIGQGARADGAFASALFCHVGQLLHSAGGIAEMLQQTAKGARSHILAADQAQPIKSVCIIMRV